VSNLRRLTLLVIALVVLVSCEGDSEPRSGADTPSDAAPTPSSSATPTSPGELEAEWSEDADDNGAPDFIEADLGYDPEIDDCVAESGCSSPDLQAGIDLIERRNNTLLILDASGSMAGSAGAGMSSASTDHTS
jgi:hypothetical protein